MLRKNNPRASAFCRKFDRSARFRKNARTRLRERRGGGVGEGGGGVTVVQKKLNQYVSSPRWKKSLSTVPRSYCSVVVENGRYEDSTDNITFGCVMFYVRCRSY